MKVPLNFFLSTASTLEGYKVIKQYGVVFGEVCFKHGFLKSLGAGLSNAIDSFKFGSREMTGSAKLIEDARDYAYQKMITEAKNKGANAIIAIDSDNTIGGDIMYISLYGTAVKVVSEADYEKELELEKQRAEQLKMQKARRDQALEERKQQIRDERRKYIEENGLILDGSEDVEIEDLFLSELPDAKTVQDIWNSWLKYGLESSHKQLDSYIMMKLDTEKVSGTPANLDSIKEAIVKVLEKDKAEG